MVCFSEVFNVGCSALWKLLCDNAHKYSSMCDIHKIVPVPHHPTGATVGRRHLEIESAALVLDDTLRASLEWVFSLGVGV